MTEIRPVVHVIEDDVSVLKGLARLLRAWNYDVLTSVSARAFLDHADAHGADCLVVDVHMPGLSGLDLQRELNRSGHDVPVVFVTGHGDALAEETALTSGAAAFLKKPFTDQDLLRAVERAIASGRQPADRR